MSRRIVTVTAWRFLCIASLALSVSWHLKGALVGFMYTNGVTTLFPQAITINGINASGDFVGTTQAQDAFVYQAGVLTDLGPGGATGINNSGQVVGAMGLDAFSYSNGVLTNLGMPFGNFAGGAVAVNDSGAVTGYSESNVNTPSVTQTSWLINGSTTTNLGTLPGGLDLTGPFAINDADQVVGDAQIAPGVNHMYIWTPSTGMVDLGLGIGDANAINGLGDVVGWVEGVDPDPDAFLYYNGASTNLQRSVFAPAGWLGSEATAINDAGQIAGVGLYPDGQGGVIDFGFLLTPNSSPSGYALTVLGENLFPTALNDSGVVVGMDNDNAAPEPSQLAPVACALLVIGAYRRRRPKQIVTGRP